MRNDEKNKRGGFRTNAERKPTGNKTIAIRIDERLQNLVINLKNALIVGDLTNADIEIIQTILKKHDAPTNTNEKIRLELELPKLYGYSIKNHNRTTELTKQARQVIFARLNLNRRSASPLLTQLFCFNHFVFF